jgi:hypothetical protein
MADGDHDAIQGRLWDILWDFLWDIGLPYAGAEGRDHQHDYGQDGSSVHQRSIIPLSREGAQENGRRTRATNQRPFDET